MSDRPTAAAPRFPYAHVTVEEADTIADMEESGLRDAAEIYRRRATSQAHFALNRAQRKATHTNHPALSPKLRARDAAGVPTSSSPAAAFPVRQ